VKAVDKEILQGVDIAFEVGKNYVVLGKNGSGKSTLSSVIAGSPKYVVESGTITLDGEDLLAMSPEERSQKGIFLSFQNVPEIKWVNLWEYLRTIYNHSMEKKHPDTKPLSPFLFKRFVKKFLDELKIDEAFLTRDLNVGFSGWEKRKIEILQMKLLEPKYIILDEIDSGLDVDAFKTIAELLKTLNNPSNTLIIITHYFNILEYVPFDQVIVLENGCVKIKGGQEIIEEVKKNGFETL
jgi:Fe-S cluster assembly ATP-binding protein